MGYDLLSQRNKEEYRWIQPFWSRLLKLAEKNGWNSKGTTAPKDHDSLKDGEWNGNYWYNSRQVVEADDALNLAAALERSLGTLPKEYIKIDMRVTKDSETGKWKEPDYSDIPLESFFSGDPGRKDLEDFIAFCRKGSFEIG